MLPVEPPRAARKPDTRAAARAVSIFDDPVAGGPALAEAVSEETGFRRAHPIADATSAASTLERIHEGLQDVPIVLRGFASHWPAVAAWDRGYVCARWGHLVVRALVGMPSYAVPFHDPEARYRRTMRLAAFWDELEARGRCYLDQNATEAFRGLEDDVCMGELLGSRPRSELNFWISRATKSGMHFDPEDNFVVMIRGHKLFAMAPPQENVRLYPFLDSIMKSRVDVERPDFGAFPLAAEVELHVAQVQAGDVLFIPIGWWHHVAAAADEPSISLNCWFGRKLPMAAFAARAFALGPSCVAQVARDFVVRGVLGRPFEPRFYCEPDGVKLYRKVRALWTGAH